MALVAGVCMPWVIVTRSFAVRVSDRIAVSDVPLAIASVSTPKLYRVSCESRQAQRPLAWLMEPLRLPGQTGARDRGFFQRGHPVEIQNPGVLLALEGTDMGAVHQIAAMGPQEARAGQTLLRLRDGPRAEQALRSGIDQGIVPLGPVQGRIDQAAGGGVEHLSTLRNIPAVIARRRLHCNSPYAFVTV